MGKIIRKKNLLLSPPKTQSFIGEGKAVFYHPFVFSYFHFPSTGKSGLWFLYQWSKRSLTRMQDCSIKKKKGQFSFGKPWHSWRRVIETTTGIICKSKLCILNYFHLNPTLFVNRNHTGFWNHFLNQCIFPEDFLSMAHCLIIVWCLDLTSYVLHIKVSVYSNLFSKNSSK